MTGTVGIIGVGEIARSIVEGLSSLESAPQVVLSPRSATISAALAARFGNVAIGRDNQAVADAASILIVSVRPDQVSSALSPLRINPATTVVCVAAGVSIAALQELIEAGTPVVRAVPLPAVKTCESVTPLHPDIGAATELFDALGGSLIVEDEADFATFTVMSSTVSTHLGYLSEIVAWAARHGLDSRDADRFVRAVFSGVTATFEDQRDLAKIAADHETPGGLNEQLRTTWLDLARLDAALDDVLRRVLS